MQGIISLDYSYTCKLYIIEHAVICNKIQIYHCKFWNLTNLSFLSLKAEHINFMLSCNLACQVFLSLQMVFIIFKLKTDFPLIKMTSHNRNNHTQLGCSCLQEENYLKITPRKSLHWSLGFSFKNRFYFNLMYVYHQQWK